MVFHGSLTNVNAALAGLAYTPAADYNGGALLTITSDDLGNFGSGGALTDTDTVAITVTAVNDAPVAVNDSATTAEDTAVAIDAAANDTDVDGAARRSSPARSRARPTARRPSSRSAPTPARSCTRRPSTTTAPTASPTSRPTAASTTAPATVSITVTAVNDAPVNSVPGPRDDGRGHEPRLLVRQPQPGQRQRRRPDRLRPDPGQPRRDPRDADPGLDRRPIFTTGSRRQQLDRLPRLADQRQRRPRRGLRAGRRLQRRRAP